MDIETPISGVPGRLPVSGQLHRNVRLLTWFNFFLDFVPYAPIEIIYFSEITGSYALGLSIFSVVTISSSLFEVPTGIFSDRIGRKRTMLLGSICKILAVVFYALGGSFLVLAMGALCEGIGRAFFSGNNDALLYDSLADRHQESLFPTYLGKTSSMFQMGLAFAALLGGFVASYSFKWVFWIAVIPQTICAVISLFFVEPERHRRESTNVFAHLREALRHFGANGKLRLLTIVSAVRNGVGETMWQFEPVFISMFWPTWALGIVRFFSNIFAAGGFWYAGGIIKRFTALRVLVTNLLFNRIVGIVAFGFPTVLSPALLTVASVFYGLGMTAQGTLLQREFTDHQRATLGSLNAFIGSLFFAVFAFLFGFIADRIGATHSLLLGEFILLPLFWVFWRIFQHDRRRKSAMTGVGDGVR
ncbi:TPA: hypothetical protein DCL30_04885 [Candidatus Peribacteria bacterium]|nr:MAG: hypothetical protein A2529_04945 [Candidatus Peribacteria bacterium RIFOXYD2_FULL_58_15]HAI98838.1 hypothetical protein [Candidatus Peribacteria bacterium]HAS34040.1 hypothetical protein [Candidatus Peribacteria bacterium]